MNLGNKSKSVQVIEEALKKRFPHYPPEYPPLAVQKEEYCIYVRVVSDRFKGKDRGERDDMIYPIIHELPREISDDVMVLVLLTPDELEDSIINREFEPRKTKRGKRKPSAA